MAATIIELYPVDSGYRASVSLTAWKAVGETRVSAIKKLIQKYPADISIFTLKIWEAKNNEMVDVTNEIKWD